MSQSRERDDGETVGLRTMTVKPAAPRTGDELASVQVDVAPSVRVRQASMRRARRDRDAVEKDVDLRIRARRIVRRIRAVTRPRGRREADRSHPGCLVAYDLGCNLRMVCQRGARADQPARRHRERDRKRANETVDHVCLPFRPPVLSSYPAWMIGGRSMAFQWTFVQDYQGVSLIIHDGGAANIAPPAPNRQEGSRMFKYQLESKTAPRLATTPRRCRTDDRVTPSPRARKDLASRRR